MRKKKNAPAKLREQKLLVELRLHLTASSPEKKKTFPERMSVFISVTDPFACETPKAARAVTLERTSLSNHTTFLRGYNVSDLHVDTRIRIMT